MVSFQRSVAAAQQAQARRAHVAEPPRFVGAQRVGTTQPGIPVVRSTGCDPTEVVEVRWPLGDMEPNQRGFEITLQPPDEDQGTRTQTVVAARTNGCKNGHLLCITLGITLAQLQNNSRVPLHTQFTHPMVRAVIGYGVGSTSFEAECDWMLGTQLAVAAEYVEYVKARYIKNTLPWAPVPEPDAPAFRVSAGLSYGGIGRTSNPARFTELVQLENPDTITSIQIPQFASSLTVLPVVGSCEIQVFGFGGLYAVPYTIVTPLTNAQHNNENQIPLQNGARFVQVQNTSEEGPLIVFLVFGLNL